MKKSKIIVPALAMIGLSAVASVTGSVAWFTAQRTGSITTDDFAIVKTDGNLTVTAAAGVGTSTESLPANTQIKCITGSKLANASFNPKTKQLYSATGADNAGAATGFAEVGDPTSYKTAVDGSGNHDYILNKTEKFYYAFTWSVTVTYNWESDHRSLNIFFDFNASSMSAKDSENHDITAGNETTAKGFRIAIVNSDASHTIVYSGLENVAEFKATTGTAVANHDVYGNGDLNSSKTYSYFGKDKYAFSNTAVGSANSYVDGKYAHHADGSADQTTKEDYLATLAFDAEHPTSTSTTFTCVAWYEGNDSNIISENDLEKVKSTIGFYSAIAA